MATAIFATAQSNFIQHAALTPEEQHDFKLTSLDVLRQVISSIQGKQETKRGMRYMRRLEPFLIAMEQYGKVLEVFLNASDIVAFIWGPMKFILLTASTHLEALDSVLDAYQNIGEQIPLLVDFELFASNTHMREVLSMIYTDILDFHREALRHFKKPFWRQVFSATWRGFASRISHLTNNMQRHRQLIESRATIIQFQEMCGLRKKAEEDFMFASRAEDDRRRDVIRQWLTGFNNETEQDAHRDRRSVGGDSGRWLLNDARYQGWYDHTYCDTPMLWLTGIPGAGKTILASVIIDELIRLSKTPGISVAYFYCKFGISTRNSFLAVARSILAQLLANDSSLLPYIYEEASVSCDTVLTSQSVTERLLKFALDTYQKRGTTYLVIDGIDECGREDRKKIASWFQTVINSLSVNELGLIRCLFVSQDDGVSRNDFEGISILKLTASDTMKDIQAFVSAWHLRMEKKFGDLRAPNTHISNLITARAQGMFLFARLMVEYLADVPTREELEQELHPAVFPDGLDKAYDRIMYRMVDSKPEVLKRQLRRILGWVACAPRSLRWREIQAGVSIDLDDGTLKSSKRLLEHPKNLFAAFIELKANGMVEMIHRTAREYLFRCDYIDPAEAHGSMANLSMAYFTWTQLEEGRSTEQIHTDLRAGTYSFLDYASACWAVHLQKAIPPKSENGKAGRTPNAVLDELQETLETFVDMHWSSSCEPLRVTKSLKDDLSRLLTQDASAASEKVLQAVAWSRKQLSVSSDAPSHKEALDLWQVIGSVRSTLESIHATSLSAEEKQSLQRFYGDNWFKCPRISCFYYHEGFRNAQQRNRHVDKHDRPFLCLETDCHYATFGFATETNLKNHLFEQHGIDMLPINEFPDPVKAGHHNIHAAPETSGRLKCPNCDKTFTRKHNLNGHLRSSHEGKKPFQCGQCEKTFARSSDCKRHELQHEGKKYVCFGLLDDGTEWGCKAEFGRPDKREDHFRKAGRKCIQPLVKQKLQRDGESKDDNVDESDKLISRGEVMLPRFKEFLYLCGLGVDSSNRVKEDETGV